MVNGECSKKYPKRFAEETYCDASGYPTYKRPDNGLTVQTPNNAIVDNRWIVLHNIYLTTKYNAHINVEICNTLSVIKYLYKYVYKGHDRANMVVQTADSSSSDPAVAPPNEVNRFLDAR